MLFNLVLATVLAQPGLEPAGVGATPPKPVRAHIDSKGTLKIAYVASVCPGAGSGEMTVPVPAVKGKEKAAGATVRVTKLTMTLVEVSARHVTAYTADGRPVSPERLATLLAKERTVLLAVDGKKVDPFLLELYKEDTLVLVPPANIVNFMTDGATGSYGGAPVMVAPMPAPRRMPQEEVDKPKRPRRIRIKEEADKPEPPGVKPNK